ncbi:MAG: hypothetical protein JNL90_01170 [Planctomycetes bacterium]|nr:hypothetical protein [Planctomycetota bacterium]
MNERSRPAAQESAALDPAALVALLFFLSGAASLLLETAAVRAFLELFGSAAASLGAVGGAFLACLALGAWLVGSRADRVARPLLAYAWLETVAALGGFAALYLLRSLDGAADAFARAEQAGDPRWLGRFALAVGVLLVPVGALGATLPFLARLRAATRARGLAAGGLQAASTLGAMAGALLASLVLLRAVGVAATWQLGAALNGVVALAAFWLARQVAPLPAEGADAPTAPLAPAAGSPALAVSPSPALSLPLPLLLVAALLNGFAVLALEVLLFRGLGQAARGSQDTLGILLAAWLGASALGTAVGTLWSRRRAAGGFLAGHLVALLAPLVALLLLRVMSHSTPLSFWRFGEAAVSWSGRLVAELIGALLIAGPAAFATALAFPCACELVPRDGRFGRAVAWLSGGWAAGAALAGALVPTTLLPQFGMKALLIALALLPLLVVGLLALAAGGRALFAGRVRFVVAAAGAAALLLFAPLIGRSTLDEPLLFVQRVVGERGGFVVHYVEDSAANVAVIVHPDGEKVLAVNDQLALGGSGESRVETMQGLLPALLHAEPRRALAMGVGAGLTVAGLRDAGCQEIDAVELLPSVLTALPFFQRENGAIAADPRVRLHAGDARSFVRAAPPGSYDLVVGDLFFPWETGAGQLYAREHFERVKALLAEGGLFCQWLPAHQLRWEEIGAIGRTFCEVFDGATLWLARPEFGLPVLGLVAGRERLEIDVVKLEARLAGHRLLPELQKLGVADVRDFLALYVADEWFFREKFDESGLVTADAPRVEFAAAQRVESDAVVALHNRLRLFELKEDIVSRMTQSAVDKKRLTELKRELAGASRSMWQLYEAETNLLLAQANRAVPLPQQKNDPDALEVNAFQIAGSVLRERPDYAPAQELLVQLLLHQMRMGHYDRVTQGTKALESEAAIGPRARFANLRGMAFLLGVCDEGAVKPEQEGKALGYAAAELRRAIELDPKLVEAQVTLGIALFLTGTTSAWDEARALLGRARESIEAPDRPDGHGLPPSAEAIFTFLTGKQDEAQKWLQRAARQPWTAKIASRMKQGSEPE